jgi:hypothetical protein
MGDHNPPSANARLSPRERERGQALVLEQSDSPNPYPEPSYSPQRSTPAYHAPFSPSLPQSSRDIPYPGPPHYPSIQPYPTNFQGMPYPTTPPVPPPQFYYSYGHHPISVPAQYGYLPQEPNRSRSDASQTYSYSSQQQSLRGLRTPGPSPSLPSASPYARMTYAAPIPYPYSMALSSLPAPVYAPRNPFSAPATVPQMNPGQEYRYTGTPSPTREELDLGSYFEQSVPSSHRLGSVLLPDPGRPSSATRLALASRSQDTRLGSNSIPAPIDLSAQAEPEQQGSFRNERANSRRSYHSHLPVHRSEWVMWVGNIPSDCDRDELVRFFDSIVWPALDSPQGEDARENHKETPRSGVVSVFLIPQSNCAFVNYDSEARLLNAVARCNGVAVRPDDPRCIKLVCRVRKRDEDLKAGVGAQRGVGMHTTWVQQQKQKSKCQCPFIRLYVIRYLMRVVSPVTHGDPVHTSLPSTPAPTPSGPTPPSPSQRANTSPVAAHPDNSSGSVSYTSTNSSFLATYFPQRYFILKSLTLVRPSFGTRLHH